MKLWKKRSIRTKLLFVMAMTYLLFLGSFIYVLNELNSVGEETNSMARHSENAVKIMEIGSIIRSKFIIISDYATTNVFNQTYYEQQDQLITKHLADVEVEIDTVEEQELFEQVVAGNERFNQVAQMIEAERADISGLAQELSLIQNQAVLSVTLLSEQATEEMTASSEDVRAYIIQSSNISTFLVIVVFIVGSACMVLFSMYLTKTLNKITAQAKQISAGNLTIEPLAIRSEDELGQLSLSMNSMLSNLHQLVTKITTASVQVASSAEQLTASATETSKSTEQISEAIQSVALGAEQQVDSSANSQALVMGMSEGMEQVTQHIQQVRQTSGDTTQKAESGVAVVQHTVEQMNVIQEKSSTTASLLNELGGKSNEIGKIVGLITDVSEQTNLLALNAAIEAARAGEHGAGFAVVADEVRKLAEESAQSSNQIKRLIEDIQHNIQQSLSAMKEGTMAVEEGINMVHEAGNSFSSISASVTQVTEQIQEVTTFVQHMSQGTHTLVEASDQIVSISEQTASSTQNIAAAVEEQNASMEEISASSAMLASMAEELQAAVKTFKIY
ncbi:methyl-accepting chemotaxis protein [Bacillus horti]|uniref:Methyl-accepting chemotaxis protein n=2 Tax=Caldalkalibacillus horti TaxID=77523 RepID=A0ABT9VVT9_9BACI|nr:HAMP domain-containing methyl-accepting chemotaxis protein [Bacillus horti]MDQ0165112.1 methyl-accepting chemotaxis protein [Bacillus horti]